MESTYKQEKEEIEIDLGEILIVLLSKIPLMIAVGLFMALFIFLYSKFVMTPTYQSTTKIYILNKQENTSVTFNDLQMGTQLTKDYAELIKSRFVLESVSEQLALGMSYESLNGKVNVTSTNDTRVIAITVTDTSPVRSMRIANAVRETSSVHISNVMDIEAVNIVETANLPTHKSGPAVGRNTMVGGLAGVFIVSAITVVSYLMNDTIRTAEDVERYLNLSTLAAIPLNEGEEKVRKKKKRRK